jgi:hypothetical protein
MGFVMKWAKKEIHFNSFVFLILLILPVLLFAREFERCNILIYSNDNTYDASYFTELVDILEAAGNTVDIEDATEIIATPVRKTRARSRNGA